MKDFYKNFKYKIGDKVWIRRDGCPLQVEVKEKDFGRFGGQAYYVYLSEEKDEALKVYEAEIASSKEELCDQQIKQYEEEIDGLEESLVRAKNHKALWKTFKEKESLRYEKGKEVYLIRESMESGNHLRLYKGKMVGGRKSPFDHYWVNLGGKYDGAFYEEDLFLTPQEALDHALAENQKEQTKLAGQYQDLIKIEADLKLKEKQNGRA